MNTNMCHIILITLIGIYQLPVQAAPWEKVDLNGYLSFEYEKSVSGDNEGDTNGSFDIDLLDIVLNIKATNRLRIATDLTWEHGSATEDNRGNVAVEYAFAEYTVEDWLRLRAGKMFTHFGIYNEIHTAKPATLTVKEPLSTNKNNKFGSDIRFYPRWLNGLAIQGDVSLSDMALDYVLQVSNGETADDDQNPFEQDDNTHKAVNGRARLSPTDGIRIGFSFYTDSMEDSASNDRIDIRSYGLQFESTLPYGLSTEIEYVMGALDRKAAQKIDRSAYSIMLSHQTTKRIIPYFRYESLDPNNKLSGDSANLTTLGLNIMIDTNMVVKLELDRINSKFNNAQLSGADWTEFKAALAIGF